MLPITCILFPTTSPLHTTSVFSLSFIIILPASPIATFGIPLNQCHPRMGVKCSSHHVSHTGIRSMPIHPIHPICNVCACWLSIWLMSVLYVHPGMWLLPFFQCFGQHLNVSVHPDGWWVQVVVGASISLPIPHPSFYSLIVSTSTENVDICSVLYFASMVHLFH